MGLPTDDVNPNRHAYGDYTHRSANGQYRFEWTPFTPAIRAWENAERYLAAAVADLHEARKLPGFGLNGLADEHTQMMGTLKVLAEDAQACRVEAGKVAKLLEVAHTDYANANEASLEQYRSLTAIIDRTRSGRSSTRSGEDRSEQAQDQKRDKEIFPFDGTR